MRYTAIAIALSCAASACTAPRTTGGLSVVSSDVPEPAWRTTIVQEDAAVLDTIGDLWRRHLTTARRASARQIDAEGALLAADAALEQPELPPGSYNCRVVRLGARAGPRRLRSFPPFFCYVKGEAEGERSFTKQTGSDLPSGWLYPDGASRYIFLGARQHGAGANDLRYGTDRARDLFGVVERVGPFRWRMALPTRGGDGIDVYELTPVPVEQQPA